MGWMGGSQAERQTFARCDVFSPVPLDDESAWLLYPDQRQLYNRLWLCEFQGLLAHPCGIDVLVVPPYITKPIINLIGLSQGVKSWGSYEKGQHDHLAGHFWMPQMRGDQYSHDIVMLRGQVVQIISTRCYRHPQQVGLFTAFEVDVVPPNIERAALVTHLPEWCPGFTGVVNAETIGGYIIEVHMRQSPQWASLYGRQWPLAVSRLYDHNMWEFDPDTITGGWSIPVYDTLSMGHKLAAGDRGIEVMVTENDPWHPPGRTRTGIVNASTEHDAVEAARAIGVCEYTEDQVDAAYTERRENPVRNAGQVRQKEGP